MNKADNLSLKEYISAEDAIGLLEIRAQTLYAYVSRGLVRSIKQPDKKEHLYNRADIEKLKSRSFARSGHGPVAAAAMNWGDPIIPTSITEVTREGPMYRGHLAVDLAHHTTAFESVAELLWTGKLLDAPITWTPSICLHSVSLLTESESSFFKDRHLLDIFAIVSLKLGMLRNCVNDKPSVEAVYEAGREIIQAMVGCFGYKSVSGEFKVFERDFSIADGLCNSIGIANDPETLKALNAVMVLMADHELSPGAFAARVAASSGVALHGCIAAAICTTSGDAVGRLYDTVENFLMDSSEVDDLMCKAKRYIEAGSAVPGFDHPLYPDGDPRATFLLELARDMPKQTKKLHTIYRFIHEMRVHYGMHPRNEIGAVVLASAIGMPPYTIGALFVLARSAGWIAHIQEQKLAGTMLRPRAKFTSARQIGSI